MKRVMPMFSLLLALSALLTGCAGKPAPDLELYLLRSDAANRFSETDEPASIGLGNIRIANYINQPGIVLQGTGASVTPARYHQWAEPLRDSLRAFLANEIATAAGKPVRPRAYGETNWKRHTKQLIDISIEQLHGTGDGNATIVAYWAVLDPQARTVLSEHEFRRAEPLTTDGYPALVDAMSQLLAGLASEIAASL